MHRHNFSTGTPWEELIGYSRAVRVGNIIEITGTVASDEQGNIVGKDNPYEQTKYILQKIERVLRQAGGSLEQIVRTRMFVTDISRWKEYGKAHHEVFHSIKPCTSMIEISKLIAPGYMIEIEATAIVE
ncbi:MAG: RidA family protein [Bacteroidetes bacterium]|nr:RidA family protein [Bacteroidota bacterium]